MTVTIISALLALAGDVPAQETPGVIEGVVVNASQNNAPVAEAEVILQLQIDGQFTPVEQTISDAQGRFRFDQLPVGLDYLYLPGANRDGIHYPGRRIELTSRRSLGYLHIPVRDVITAPSPLVIRELEIVLRGEPGALQVVEGMLVENPTQATYVGEQSPDKMNPTTLSLGITPEFKRLTFDEEFFGRQFVVHDGRVVTSLPWTPGQRLLRYAYTIPNNQASREWRHRIDLPCDRVRVRVLHDNPEEIESNLPLSFTGSADEAGVVYEQRNLASGDEIVFTLGRLPIPWTTYARWAALAVLMILIAGALLLLRRSRRVATVAPTVAEGTIPLPVQKVQRRSKQRKRRRAA